MTNNEQDYEMCFRAENVVLPKTGHFGISAATGGLADDHDVFQFLTHSLHIPGKVDEQHAEDAAKLTQEYQEYQKKLEQQKEDYRKEHPEEQKEDTENWFEDYNARELRQIWEAQTNTHNTLKTLSSKLDEVIGRQERTLGLLSVSGGAYQPPAGGAPPAQIGSAGDSIRRHEVDSLVQSSNILVQTVREIRQIVGDIYGKSDTIINNQKSQPTAQIHGAGYDVQSLIVEMRNGLNEVKQNVVNVGHKLNQPTAQANIKCPTQSCLGTTTFLVGIVIHLLIMIVYNIYR
jgi:mannose-binding lectin 1